MFLRIYTPPEVSIQKYNDEHGVYANKSFNKGYIVSGYPSCEWYKSDNGKYIDSIDICIDDHIYASISPSEHGELLPDGNIEFSGYDCMTNHSCDPNVIYDEVNHHMIAIKPIYKGDELTVNYNCTNWDEYSNLIVFNCNCHSNNCGGVIRGLKYLSHDEQTRLIGQGGVSEYCLKKLTK